MIGEVKAALFGASRIYLDHKKLIVEKGKTQFIPDGYFIDFPSTRRPVLYVVAVELGKNDPFCVTLRSN